MLAKLVVVVREPVAPKVVGWTCFRVVSMYCRSSALPRFAQEFLRESPARERLGVSMHDADTHAAHLCDEPGGQCAEAGAQGREPTRSLPQALDDPVRALDLGIADKFGITAAAACVSVVAGKLGLDVAAQRGVPQHLLVDRGKRGRVHVEPVEVAVEHQRHGIALAGGAVQDRRQRRTVAVEAADHVERPGLELREMRQVGRRIPVRKRATAPRPRIRREGLIRHSRPPRRRCQATGRRNPAKQIARP